jgi:hypothetical protein
VHFPYFSSTEETPEKYKPLFCSSNYCQITGRVGLAHGRITEIVLGYREVIMRGRHVKDTTEIMNKTTVF